MTQSSRPAQRGEVLPEVTARERDFWRRAVAAERERLALGGGKRLAPLQPGTH